MASKVARMNKILRPDGKAVVAVLDHGMAMGPMPGIMDPRPTVEKMVAGGIDAFAASFGTAVKCSGLLDHVGLILRVDGGSTAAGHGGSMQMIFDIADTLRIGADGMICMGYVGEGEGGNLPYLAKLGSAAQEWGVPLLAEMLAISKDGGRTIDPKMVTLAARVGAEYGADLIKTTYTGDPESFKMVTSACLGLPVLILGGAKMNSDKDVLETVAGAIKGGGSGVAMGRNLWGHEHPDKIVKAVRAIVHEGASVESALKLMR